MESPAVNIPNDPDMGVQLQTPSQSIAIGLPNAARSGDGVFTAQGITAYTGRNGSANAAIPTNGGVQLLTIIENRLAPTKYDYPVTLPAGGTVKVIPGGMGAAIFDAEGQPITVVRAPWAKDANGRDVRTHFTTNGSTLTQHVAHKTRGVTYPVVADPVILPAWAIWRLLICLGGGLWGYLSGGGNSFDERLFQAAVGCLGFTTARQLFRR